MFGLTCIYVHTPADKHQDEPCVCSPPSASPQVHDEVEGSRSVDLLSLSAALRRVFVARWNPGETSQAAVCTAALRRLRGKRRRWEAEAQRKGVHSPPSHQVLSCHEETLMTKCPLQAVTWWSFTLGQKERMSLCLIDSFFVVTKSVLDTSFTLLLIISP